MLEPKENSAPPERFRAVLGVHLVNSLSNGQSPDHARPPKQWVAQVFAQLEGSLVAYVSRRLHSHDLARDVVQEAFVKLCQQSWPEIEPHATAWLYKTCRNRAIDVGRREGRMSAIHSEKDVATLHDRARSLPEEQADQGEQLTHIRRQIDELPSRQQEILRLRLHDGLSYKQIAEVTGLSVTNVGYLLHQAISKLRVRMRVS